MEWLGRFLGHALLWASKWGVLVVIFEASVKFFRGLSAGLSVDQAMALGMAFFGAGLIVLVGICMLIDYLAGRVPEVYRRQKAAKFLRDMAKFGDQKITLAGLVNVWNAGEPTENPVEAIRRRNQLRHLKAAVRQGFMQDIGPGGVVKETTIVHPSDAARFMSGWRWLQVKEEEWKDGSAKALD